MVTLINKNIKCNIMYWLCGRAFGYYISIISWSAMTVGFFIILALSGNVGNSGLVAQSLTYFALMGEFIQWVLR
jgi:hypothetical protein